jgi:hypothetical protein
MEIKSIGSATATSNEHMVIDHQTGAHSDTDANSVYRVVEADCKLPLVQLQSLGKEDKSFGSAAATSNVHVIDSLQTDVTFRDTGANSANCIMEADYELPVQAH